LFAVKEKIIKKKIIKALGKKSKNLDTLLNIEQQISRFKKLNNRFKLGLKFQLLKS